MSEQIYTPELTIGGDFIDRPYQMFSGQAAAQEGTYRLALGKSGRIWLYATGDDVYSQGGPNSDGFGGAILEFKLWNGCDSIKLKGAWHSNSDSLFKDTGIDKRNEHLTFGVIGRGRDWKDHRSVIKDLIWFDKEPTYGTFNRVDELANKLSHERREVLYYHKQSRGGSSCGPVNYKEYHVEAH